MADRGSKGLVQDTTQHIQTNVPLEKQREHMHALSFYYLSYLRQNNGTVPPGMQGPMQGGPPVNIRPHLPAPPHGLDPRKLAEREHFKRIRAMQEEQYALEIQRRKRGF